MSKKRNSPTRGSRVALSRRAFIKGAGVVAAGAGLLKVPVSGANAAAVEDGVTERLGIEAQPIELKVNTELRKVVIEPRVTLLEALRDHLRLTGTKLVCDRGSCGACTVHLDG